MLRIHVLPISGAQTARVSRVILLGALLASLTAPCPAQAAATTFTYQGRLDVSGVPASGLHDFRFRLFDASDGGVQLGPTICVNDVDVSAGVFTLPLDFGQQYAIPGSRFLEIEVRADTGADCANGSGFVALIPRQELNAAPRAIHADAAFTLDAADGSPAAAVYVDDQGEVGIGTTNPAAGLQVKTDGRNLVLEGTKSGDASSAWLGFADSSGEPHGWIGDGSSSNSDTYVASYNNDVVLYTLAGEVVTVKPSGRVGIGTGTPQSTLDVRGTVRLGSSGELFAPGGFENLRVVRGTINSSGTIAYGSGFSVVRNSAGNYSITFSTPFWDWATTTVSTMFSGTHGIVFQGGAGFATIRTFNDAGTLVDTGFNFIAVGIR